MGAELTATPGANRVHIGFFGKMNSGKSSLLNALANQQISIVSGQAGTTTDPVTKAMEIAGIGACTLLDTAGFDDAGDLGDLRVQSARKAAQKTDVAVLVFSDEEMKEELRWFSTFQASETPVVPVIGKCDERENTEALAALVEKQIGIQPLLVSAKTREGVDALKDALIRAADVAKEPRWITGQLVSDGDLVLLVMPQDIQAPAGRLILPQVQTIRELLDKKCLVMSVTTDKLGEALAALAHPPKLIITDSQVFKTVYEQKPKESMLTSFSTLFAALKGDLSYYIEGAHAIDGLTEASRVLIAECCTHAPLDEDIGRVKLPRLLRKKVGAGLTVDIVGGSDFPEDLSGYDLIIQCGACMFNRKYVISRIHQAKEQNIPMSNYGVVIAYLNGILGQIALPE
jgi:[FeFe] hydrogenase H-cluster maturation GTPase HydF